MNDLQCLECKEQLYPHDPSKPFFVGYNSQFKGVSPITGYLHPSCETCPDYPGIWDVPKMGTDVPKRVTHEPTAQPDVVTQLRGQMRYLDNKLTEHLSKSKKRDRL